jgi:pimeloyl-ACP methyl ester carboxylesterase
MELAVRYPSWVERLVVVDIGPRAYPPHHQFILDAMRGLNLDQIASRTEADRALEAQLSDWGIRQFLLKNLEWTDEKKLGWKCNLPVLESSMDRIGKPLGPLDQYVGATLFVRGLASNYIRDEDWSGILTHFPAAQLESIAGAGHWVHAEQPKAFQDAVNSFLRA